MLWQGRSILSDTSQSLTELVNEMHDRLNDEVAEPITNYLEKFPEIRVRAHTMMQRLHV